MTHPVPPNSPKALWCERFGRELDKAMRQRRIGRRTLCPAVGVGHSALGMHRAGRILPRHEVAVAYAEALDWPRLASLSREARQRECVVCARPFIDDSGSWNRLYCSPSCQNVMQKKRVGRPTRVAAAGAERRVRMLQTAVDAMCRACEPEGMCRTPECALRGVSPLPLADREQPAFVVSRGNGMASRSPEARRAAMLKAWETRRQVG